MLTSLVISAFIVLIINIPFGYWRDNVKKFSLQWVMAVHIPVPIVIMIRFAEHIGFAWYTYVFLIVAFFSGQFLGSLIHKRKALNCGKTTSCLIMDMMHPKC